MYQSTFHQQFGSWTKAVELLGLRTGDQGNTSLMKISSPNYRESGSYLEGNRRRQR